MPKIIYIEHSGTEHAIDVPEGMSLMEGATKNGVPGIDADCGGACACGTCHVYIDPDWAERAGPVSEIEESMLECTLHPAPTSRLSCQIKVTDALNGLVLRIPKSQQ